MNDQENDVPSPAPPEDDDPKRRSSIARIAIIGGASTALSAQMQAAIAAQIKTRMQSERDLIVIDIIDEDRLRNPQPEPPDMLVLDSLSQHKVRFAEARPYPTTGRRGKNTHQKKKLEALRNGKYRKQDWS